MFSVVIPLYNKADYITKAIHSVLNQTFSDFELIIVNDGSIDNSIKRINKINDYRIRILNQINSGVSTARNNGVKAAKFECIAFLDADDWWEKNYLEEMKCLIEKYPDAGLYGAKYKQVKFGKYKEADIGVNRNIYRGYINYFEVYAKTMWMPLFPSSAIVPRKIFNEFNGFRPNLKLGEDFDLWVRIALKYKIAYLNRSLVYYNQDVEANYRGVNPNKFYSPEENFIFHLKNYKEEKNADVKKLFDKLRTYNLFRYYLFQKYEKQVKEILQEVDFSKQPLSVRLKYSLPISIVKKYYQSRKILSNNKKYVLSKT